MAFASGRKVAPPEVRGPSPLAPNQRSVPVVHNGSSAQWVGGYSGMHKSPGHRIRPLDLPAAQPSSLLSRRTPTAIS